jgi:hypothetical protein
LRNAAGSTLLCLLLAVTTTQCGGSSGAEKKVAQAAGKRVATWLGKGPRAKPPSKLKLPALPAVSLVPAARQISGKVRNARPALAEVVAIDHEKKLEEATAFTQGVLCDWYRLYVEDPTRVLPDEADFRLLLLKNGLQEAVFQIGEAPRGQDFYDALTSFREAIERGRSLQEDARNASIAAVCALPL